MKELEQLKRRLFKQEPSEKDTVYNLIEVMKIVGGYEQLMNLSISSCMQIIKYLNFINKEQEKAYRKIKNKRLK